MKKYILIALTTLLISCGHTDPELNTQAIQHDMVVTDNVILQKLYKLEIKVEKLTRANDSIAYEFEHYRYWLWKEHNLTEHDYSTYDYSFSICKPAPINEELQKRTKLPSKDKNSLY